MGINTKESLGLHTICDGPDAGKYSRAGMTNMVIKAPPVGTPHFTNWDAGLTSLEKTTKERFESRTATNFLDDYLEEQETTRRFKCGAKDIKIVDNIAAVSYPTYTDIKKLTGTSIGFTNKVLTEHTGEIDNLYNQSCIIWQNINEQGIVLIPQFNLNVDSPVSFQNFNLKRWNKIDLDFYILLTYGGQYSYGDPDCDGENDDPISWFSFIYNKKQLLKPKSGDGDLQVGEYEVYELNNPNPAVVNEEPLKIIRANIGHALDNIVPSVSETYSIGSDAVEYYGLGYIECSVAVIKYLPIAGCGKVDLYVKKNGKISSYQENGKLVSLNHNLQNGDIIKIYDAKNSDINGVKYVQIVDDSTFIIYSDSDFTQRVNSYYEGFPSWSAYGNIYNEESQSWDYLGSLIGSNNYTGTGQYARDLGSSVLHPKLTKYTLTEKLNNAKNFDDIFKLDFNLTDEQFETLLKFPYGRSIAWDSLFSSINFIPTGIPLEDQKTEIKTKPQAYTYEYVEGDPFPYHLWTNYSHYLTDFEFGCSIDLIKHKDRYVLAIGQKGLDYIRAFDSIHLSEHAVYGSVFLYDILVDSNNKPLPFNSNPVRARKPFNETYDLHDRHLYTAIHAYTGDTEIAVPYKTINTVDTPTSDGFTGGFANTWLAPLLQNLSIIPEQFRYPTTFYDDNAGSMRSGTDVYHNIIENGQGMDYWYGSMIYNYADIISANEFDTTAGYKIYNTTNNCRNNYFTNLKIPEFLPANQTYWATPESWAIRSQLKYYYIYPFVDNFGKAVALSSDGSKLTLFASSTTKPIVQRADFTNCNPDLNKTHCGYVHVFNLEDYSSNGNDYYTVTKTQKIYDLEASTLPSGKYYGFYYKAKKFASCITVNGDELVFGQTKPIDYHTGSTGVIEKSKIFVYKKLGSQYVKINKIENKNHNSFTYLAKNLGIFDEKELILRDGQTDTMYWNLDAVIQENTLCYAPDRFGSWFKYNGNILIINAFDIYNEDGEYHGSNNAIYGPLSENTYEFNRPIDYLHVYEKNNDNWNYITKIAPSFDSYDPSYSYSDISVGIENSLRNLGNKNYSNTNFNSVTWDIDLTGCYDLINDRILLKDPISYSVFQKGADYNTVTFQNTFTLDKYFTYDESYQAESGLLPSCQLIFDRVSAIHKYDNYLDDFRNLYCQNNKSTDIPTLNYKTPVYFINIPIDSESVVKFNSITIKLEEIRSINAGLNLKLVLFKKDPRTTIWPAYTNICSPTPSDDANEKWRSSTTYPNQTFLRGGAFDSSLWKIGGSDNSWDSCLNVSCMSKLINATNILISGARRDYTFVIDNTQVDINDYIITDNLILNSSNNRIFNREGVPSETIEFNDISNIGYDASINVEASIIIGFVYQPIEYKINTDFSARADIRIVDAIFNGYSNLKPSPTSDINYVYQCKFNKIVSFDYVRQYYNSPADKTTPISSLASNAIDTFPQNKIIYTNPIIKAGVVQAAPAALNDDRDGIREGVFSKSYDVLSIDNYGIESDLFNVFNHARSLDLQYLETLPLYINSVESVPYINLFLKTITPSSSSLDLFLQNAADTGVLPLYIAPLASSSGSQDFIINASYAATGDITHHMVGGPAAAMSMFIKVPEYSSGFLNTYMRGYDFASGNFSLYIGDIMQSVFPLYLKTNDPTSNFNGLNQIIYGSTNGSSFSSNNATLFIDVFDDSRQSVENNISLNIASPNTYIQSGVNSLPFYIGQIVKDSSGNLSLFNFGGFGGSFVASGINLFIKNTGIDASGNMTLVMPNRGFDNSIVMADNISLFLRQVSSSEDINLFMDSAIRSTGAFDLYLKTGVGVLSSGNTTFIRGYRS